MSEHGILDTDHDSFSVQGKDKMLRRLRDCLGLPDKRKTLPESDTGTESSPNKAGISELEKIIQEIFPQNSLCFEEPSEMLELADMSSDTQHCQDDAINLQENSVSTPLSCLVSIQESEEEVAPKNIASNHRPVLEESKDSCFVDSKHDGKHDGTHHGTHHVAPTAPVSVPPVFPLQKYEITYEEPFESQVEEETVLKRYPSQLSSPEQKPGRSREALEKRRNWIPDMMKNGVLTADPLMLLTLLLIVSALLIGTVIFLASFLIFVIVSSFNGITMVFNMHPILMDLFLDDLLESVLKYLF